MGCSIERQATNERKTTKKLNSEAGCIDLPLLFFSCLVLSRNESCTLNSRVVSVALENLHDRVSPGCPLRGIGSTHGAFLQQSHQLTHRVMDHNLSITFHKNIQLRVFVWSRLLASRVEGAFRGNGGASRLEDLGDVCTVGDSPTCFFYRDGQ